MQNFSALLYQTSRDYHEEKKSGSARNFSCRIVWTLVGGLNTDQKKKNLKKNWYLDFAYEIAGTQFVQNE